MNLYLMAPFLNGLQILQSDFFDEFAPNLSQLIGYQSPQRARELNVGALDRMIHNQKNTPSIRKLFEFLKHHKPLGSYDEEITDVRAEEKLCLKYGFKYNMSRKRRRRIFHGSTIAYESWHSIGTHSAEAYGLYHTAVFIESNLTFSSTPRQMRFVQGSADLDILRSGIFGPLTDVQVGNYINDADAAHNPLLIENLQREVILKHWKDSGMKADDIGIIGDVDEMFTRDFLLAAQTCDVPEFRMDQDCRTPKVIADTLVFESTPTCISNEHWFHPDMIIGECIDGIGDAELHSPPAERIYRNGTLGHRITGKGKYDGDWGSLPNRSKYPLWKPVDFRSTAGGRQHYIEKNRKQKTQHTGFHLHNYFTSLSTLRHKYSTYSHSMRDVESKSLGQIHKDSDLMVKCVMDRKNSSDPSNIKIRNGGLSGVIEGGGEVPLLFRYPDYVNARHSELKKEIMEDEAKYGNASRSFH